MKTEVNVAPTCRDAYLDNFKGILILLVLLGHVLEWKSSALDWSFGSGGIVALIYCVIYSFHMPAFVFISGYFSSSKKNIIDHFSIFLLYVLVQLAWTFYHAIICHEMPSLRELLLYNPGWGAWYLMSLFFWRCLTPLLEKVRYPLLTLLFFMGYGTLVGLINHCGNELSLSRTIVFLPFFFAGFLVRKYDLLNYFGTSFHWLDFGFVIYSAILWPIVVGLAYYQTAGLLHCEKSFEDCSVGWKIGVVFRFFFYLSAFAAIRWLLLIIPRCNMVLTKIGYNSLIIYLSHFYLILLFRVDISTFSWLYIKPQILLIFSIVVCSVLLIKLNLNQIIIKNVEKFNGMLFYKN